MSWMLIENIKDNDKIFKGACIRFYNTAKSITEHRALPCGEDDPIDYIISAIYNNSEYYQLTCLTQGEGGNITCVLKRENGSYFVTGKEIKRMLQTDLYKVLIRKEPEIIIN
jgi:hypothetical protein